MAVEREFLEHVLELFSGLAPLRIGRMFSGVGIYAEETAMFAMISGNGAVYMKSDATTQDEFLAAGSEPFFYTRNGKITQVQSLMTLPESALDDPEEAMHWAVLALPPARAAAAEKQRKKR